MDTTDKARVLFDEAYSELKKFRNENVGTYMNGEGFIRGYEIASCKKGGEMAKMRSLASVAHHILANEMPIAILTQRLTESLSNYLQLYDQIKKL